MLFLSLDGGGARECSEEWAFMTHRASDRNVRYKGISNLNSGMFKSFTDDFKMRVFKAALESNRNLIIPDTCATPLPGLPSNMSFMIQELKSHGYNIVMTAVSASKEKCKQNGTSREMKEGKKYNSLSWSFAVDKIPVCFRHVRELGYTQQTFFVTENTNWNKPRTLLVPPQYVVFEREAPEYYIKHSVENHSNTRKSLEHKKIKCVFLKQSTITLYFGKVLEDNENSTRASRSNTGTLSKLQNTMRSQKRVMRTDQATLLRNPLIEYHTLPFTVCHPVILQICTGSFEAM